MSLAALLNLGGGEIILISALILILLGAKSLPEITEGFRVGMKEFRKAAREVTKELAERFDGEYASNRQNQIEQHGIKICAGF